APILSRTVIVEIEKLDHLQQVVLNQRERVNGRNAELGPDVKFTERDGRQVQSSTLLNESMRQPTRPLQVRGADVCIEQKAHFGSSRCGHLRRSCYSISKIRSSSSVHRGTTSSSSGMRASVWTFCSVE